MTRSSGFARWATVARQVTMAVMIALLYRRLGALTSPLWVVMLYLPVMALAWRGRPGAAPALLVGAPVVIVFGLYAVRGLVATGPAVNHLLPSLWELRLDLALVSWQVHYLPAAAAVAVALGVEFLVPRRPALWPPVVAVLLIVLTWIEVDPARRLFAHPTHYAAPALLLALGTVLASRWQAESSLPVAPRAPLGALMATLAVLLIAMAGALVNHQQRALAAGGGLVRPTLFRFDLSEYLSLESQIGLNRELVMIYHETDAPAQRLLRRYVLSTYTNRHGFTRSSVPWPGEAVPPTQPRAATHLDLPARLSPVVTQEYYLVNFDPTALIVVNEPHIVVPLTNWRNSSFQAVYRVESRAASGGSPPGSSWRDLGVPPVPSAAWLAHHTYIGRNDRIRELAQQVTAGIEGYYEQVVAIERYLLNEYYYSLNPGVAPDGDQLTHFLFASGKGYCSYFAFAMALMVRSLGIPARVAVGFLTDPRNAVFGFQPIRADFAHAWVEVWFGPYGWIEFDPTSQNVAPGELVETEAAIDRQQLNRFVEEILGNVGRNTDPSPITAPARPTVGERMAQAARRFGWRIGAFLLGLAVVLRYLWPYRDTWRGAPRDRARRVATIVLLARRRLAISPEPPAVRAALVQVTDLYRKARFDRRFLPADLHATRRAAKQLRRALRQAARGRYLSRVAWRPALFILFVLGTLTAGPTLPAQGAVPSPTRGPDAPLEAGVPIWMSPREAEDAIWTQIDAENYDRALLLIQSARRIFPTDQRFPLLEADLFFDQRLYQLAERAYRSALGVGAERYSTTIALAQAVARQNREAEAIQLYERLLTVYEPDARVVGDLAWLYFKTHRLTRARDLLEAAIVEHSEDRYLYMTLATVTAAQYRLQESRAQYHRAIELARVAGDRLFEAVAHYNLSILLNQFLLFDDALAAAERAVLLSERSSGYLIRGELFEQRYEFARAAADYERADSLDGRTPLARMNLAGILLEAGDVESALAYAEAVYRRRDRNWLHSFGTDERRFERQVYDLLWRAHEAAANAAWTQRRRGLIPAVQAAARRIKHRTLAWYYEALTRRRLFETGLDFASGEREVDHLWATFSAFDRNPTVARPYFARAEARERVIIPAAAAANQTLLARATKDAALAEDALARLDPQTQRSRRAEALAVIVQHAKAVRGELAPRRESAALELYTLNPGAFIRQGIRVPMAVELFSPGAPTVPLELPWSLRRTLRLAGVRQSAGAPLVLRLEWDGARLNWAVFAATGPQREGTLREGTVRTAGDRGALDEAIFAAMRTATRLGLGAGAR